MQPILQQLFQVSALEDVSQERLESFVEEHPSFGIAHFLLSRKLQAEGSSRFPEEARRTCLYFSNPFWLQWLLGDGNGTAPAARTMEPATEAPVVHEPVIDARETISDAQEATPEELEPPAETPEATPEAPVTEEPVPPIPAAEGADRENVVTVAEQAYSETETRDDLAEALSADETPTETETETDPGISAAERLLRSIEEAKELRGTLHRMNDDLSVETALAGETLEEPAEEPAEAPATPAAPATSATSEEPAEPAIPPEPVAPIAASAAAPIQDEEPPFVLEEPAEEEQSPARQEAAPAATVGSQDILFEPYHTIDYFASQGIKLTLEENPADTLGKQLKSFTDWLKSMRRLPQKDREVVPDRVAEEAVQTIAAHSIEGKDVLTETMAEVLVKQGMRDRARAVYEKLSLLNPDKRAYFAAKIEQLNIS